MSPLHLDQPLPEAFVKEARRTWEDALDVARMLLDDSQPRYAGTPWGTSDLWKEAQELAETEPVLAAALLLVLSEHSGLLDGDIPLTKTL